MFRGERVCVCVYVCVCLGVRYNHFTRECRGVSVCVWVGVCVCVCVIEAVKEGRLLNFKGQEF